MTKEIFEQLTAYKYIFVTGPQRSGTTIAAAMIAYTLGKEFCPEERIGQKSLRKLFPMMKGPDFVLQCPALLPQIDQLYFDDTAVVIMKRDTFDINLSIERINWDGGEEEIQRYKDLDRLRESWWGSLLSDYGGPSKAITAYKYQFFHLVQADKMQMPCYWIEHDSLSWHPLWIEKKERKDFSPRQISQKYINATEERIK